MMSEMVFLEVSIVGGESEGIQVSQICNSQGIIGKGGSTQRAVKECDLLLVMEEVMCLVVTNVSENTAGEDGQGGKPIIKEDGLRQLVERCCEYHKQRRWHDKPVSVHGKVMVYAV